MIPLANGPPKQNPPHLVSNNEANTGRPQQANQVEIQEAHPQASARSVEPPPQPYDPEQYIAAHQEVFRQGGISQEEPIAEGTVDDDAVEDGPVPGYSYAKPACPVGYIREELRQICNSQETEQPGKAKTSQQISLPPSASAASSYFETNPGASTCSRRPAEISEPRSQPTPMDATTASVLHDEVQAPHSGGDEEDDPTVAGEACSITHVDGFPHWRTRIPKGTTVEDIITNYPNHLVGSRLDTFIQWRLGHNQVYNGQTAFVKQRQQELGIVGSNTTKPEGFMSNRMRRRRQELGDDGLKALLAAPKLYPSVRGMSKGLTGIAFVQGEDHPYVAALSPIPDSRNANVRQSVGEKTSNEPRAPHQPSTIDAPLLYMQVPQPGVFEAPQREQQTFETIFEKKVSVMPQGDTRGSFFGRPFFHSGDDFENSVVPSSGQAMIDCDSNVNYIAAERTEKLKMRLALLGWSRKDRIACAERLRSAGIEAKFAVRLQTSEAAASMLKKEIRRFLCTLENSVLQNLAIGIVTQEIVEAALQGSLIGLMSKFDRIKTNIQQSVTALNQQAVNPETEVHAETLNTASGNGPSFINDEPRSRKRGYDEDEENVASYKKPRLELREPAYPGVNPQSRKRSFDELEIEMDDETAPTKRARLSEFQEKKLQQSRNQEYQVDMPIPAAATLQQGHDHALSGIVLDRPQASISDLPSQVAAVEVDQKEVRRQSQQGLEFSMIGTSNVDLGASSLTENFAQDEQQPEITSSELPVDITGLLDFDGPLDFESMPDVSGDNGVDPFAGIYFQANEDTQLLEFQIFAASLMPADHQETEPSQPE